MRPYFEDLRTVLLQIAIHCPLLIAGQLANKSCSAPGTPRRRELCGSKSLDAEQRGFQRRCSSHLTRKGGGGGSGPTAVWQRGVRLGSRTGAQQLCCRATVGAPFHSSRRLCAAGAVSAAHVRPRLSPPYGLVRSLPRRSSSSDAVSAPAFATLLECNRSHTVQCSSVQCSGPGTKKNWHATQRQRVARAATADFPVAADRLK